MIYTIKFSTEKKRDVVITLSNGGGEEVELLPTSKPFTIQIDDNEFLYAPTRFSGAKISVISDKVLTDLFSTQYKNWKVEVMVKGALVWQGYIKPEAYSQGYSNKLEELQIECMSAMSVLEYIPFKRSKSNKRDGLISIKDIIDSCIKESGAEFNSVVYPTSMTLDLSKCYVMEQNFFDEDGKAMSYKEVLEEVCKLFCWTCCDWDGSLYFVDYDSKRPYSGGKSESKSVQDIGFRGGDQSVDILGGYNKVRINCSSYGNDTSVVPELTYEGKELAKWKKEYNTTSSGRLEEKEQTFVEKTFVEPPKGVTLYKWQDNSDYNKVVGATMIKARFGKLWDYDTDIRELEAVQLRINNGERDWFYPRDEFKPFLTFESQSDIVFPPGAFVISFSTKTCFSDNKFFKDKKEEEWLDMHPMYNEEVMEAASPFFVRISVSGKGYFKTAERERNGYWEEGKYSTLKPIIREGGDFRQLKNEIPPILGYKERGCVLWFNKEVRGRLKVELGYDCTRFYYSKKVADKISYNERRNMEKDGTFNPAIGYFIKDLKVRYIDTKSNNPEEHNKDTSYENIVNGEYINSLDDIELKINTYNNEGICFAKLMADEGYIEEIPMEHFDKPIRPEEAIISRIVHQYSQPKVKLTQQLAYDGTLSPITFLSDNTMVNKRFAIIGGEIDLAREMFECEMIEVV